MAYLYDDEDNAPMNDRALEEIEREMYKERVLKTDEYLDFRKEEEK